MAVPKAKRPKQRHTPDYRKGLADGAAYNMELVFALLIENEGWSVEKVEQLVGKIMEWEDAIKDPEVLFYQSNVRNILKKLHDVRMRMDVK